QPILHAWAALTVCGANRGTDEAFERLLVGQARPGRVNCLPPYERYLCRSTIDIDVTIPVRLRRFIDAFHHGQYVLQPCTGLCILCLAAGIRVDTEYQSHQRLGRPRFKQKPRHPSDLLVASARLHPNEAAGACAESILAATNLL